MSRKLMLAVGIQVLVMGLVLVQPLLVRATGTIVFLETEKMDPRSLFRGDYVILGYTLAQNILPADQASEAAGKFTPVYVTVSTERPASFVAVGFEPPQLKPDQACIVGRSRGRVRWISRKSLSISSPRAPDMQSRAPAARISWPRWRHRITARLCCWGWNPGEFVSANAADLQSPHYRPQFCHTPPLSPRKVI